MPTGHAVHAPPRAKEPTAQAVHDVEPGVDEVPGAHAVHTAAPAVFEKVPTGRLAHEPATENSPGLHEEQLRAPPVSVHVFVAAARAHARALPEEPGLQNQR